jgi:hypothetical protein
MEPRAHGRIVRSNGRGSPLRHRHPREATQTAGLAVADLVRPHRPFDREGHNEGLHQEAPEIDAQPEVHISAECPMVKESPESYTTVRTPRPEEPCRRYRACRT